MSTPTYRSSLILNLISPIIMFFKIIFLLLLLLCLLLCLPYPPLHIFLNILLLLFIHLMLLLPQACGFLPGLSPVLPEGPCHHGPHHPPHLALLTPLLTLHTLHQMLLALPPLHHHLPHHQRTQTVFNKKFKIIIREAITKQNLKCGFFPSWLAFLAGCIYHGSS